MVQNLLNIPSLVNLLSKGMVLSPEPIMLPGMHSSRDAVLSLVRIISLVMVLTRVMILNPVKILSRLKLLSRNMALGW